jgi:hypothetical protein
MGLAPNIVTDLWLPPVLGLGMATLAMYRTPLRSDWRRQGLSSMLKAYGYSSHDIVVAWFSIAAVVTGFIYGGILVGYRDWLFRHEPIATMTGIGLVFVLVVWGLIFHRRRTDEADAKLLADLSSISERTVPESKRAGKNILRYWGFANLVLVAAYLVWIAMIFRKY